MRIHDSSHQLNRWLSAKPLLYTPKLCSSSLCFALYSHLISPDHFYVSVTLSFPGRRPVHTFALVDSGSSGCCILDWFAQRHSLPCMPKEVPVLITAVDDHPIPGGLVMHDVVTRLSVDAHTELI
jgi:hypothetical protein